MTKKKSAVIVLLAFAGIAGFAMVVIGGLFYLLAPTNDRDNNDPGKRVEMASITLEWGQLAKFPETAKNFTIKTEGGMMTRTFVGSFTDAPQIIIDWLERSTGVSEGKEELQADGSIRYILKMGGGASFGEVIVSPDKSHVQFSVSWS